MTVRRMVFVVGLLAVLLLAPQAKAAVDVEFGAAVNVNDNTSLFFGVSSRYYEREPRVVETWSHRVPNPDDLSVLMFLSARSGRNLDAVFALRRAGLSWWDVSVRLGVPADVWFVPVAHKPGPPYGKAYGHWKKHGKNHYAYRVDDRTCRDLVAVRVIHDYYGVPVDRAMEMRRKGGRIDHVVSNEYRSRHGKGGKHGKHGKAQEASMKGHDQDRDDQGKGSKSNGKSGNNGKGGHKAGKSRN